jgi:hypothetical protein
MDALKFASDIRTACQRAAVAAYEDAGIQGLCHEGRWEAAVSAMQMIDLQLLVQKYGQADSGPA